jgi:hypothetical protein
VTTLTHANGAAHVPAFPPVQLPPSGPVSPWPRSDSDPETEPREEAPVAEPAPAAARVAELRLPRLLSAATRLRVPGGDAVITWSMAATVAVVAVDAAIVSYSHIYALATGQMGSGTETGIQPRLLPLSIDGVIAEASLVLLYAARHKLKAPRLATFMLWLGIAATVAANVTHGLPSSMLPPVAHVVISALLSAWPAGAFIGSVEMAMQLVRAARDVAAVDSGQDTDNSRDTNADMPADSGDDGGGDKPKPPGRTRARADPVTTAIKGHPEWDNDKIAKACGVSVKTVQRRRADLRKAGTAS